MRDPAIRRAELERWIADSRRFQRRLLMVVPIGIALAIAVRVLAPGWAWLVVVTTVGLYAVGCYITWAHITDWLALLADLDCPAPTVERDRLQD